MSLLPHCHLLLKEEALAELSKYPLFKVKKVKKKGIVVAFTDRCFFLEGQHQGIKTGDTLIIYKDMLVPKSQPMFA